MRNSFPSQLIQENVPLAGVTTMRVGGPARFFSVVTTPDELKEAVMFAQAKEVPIFILGGGSNIVMSDNGFDGMVIKMDIQGLSVSSTEGDDVIVFAAAGEIWDEVVQWTVDAGLYGLENLSSIPGTVGAAPIQNIGAYGVEVRESIEWVEVFDTNMLEFYILSADECVFDYRDSIFKQKEGKGLIVTGVAFRLSIAGEVHTEYKDVHVFFEERGISNPTVHDVREAIVSIRAFKLPDPREIGTVGSFFKNPIISHEKLVQLQSKFPDLPAYSVGEEVVKIPLAWVLEHICGLKGIRYGGVGLYATQPLALVNYGAGSAYDVRAFSDVVAREVREKTGIEIEREVTFVD